MQTNTKKTFQDVLTHGGVPAWPHTKPIEALRRSVLSCLLWENEFYENGTSITERIKKGCANVSTQELSDLAVEARNVHNLRHVPLLLARELARKQGSIVGDTIEKVIQRADELSEFLALYWKDGKCPLSKQVKVGLAKAFTKFDAYQLAKYDRAREIKLRDVLFLTHAKPSNPEQAEVWKQLVEGKLPSADTWEVALSTGKEKKESFERLLREGRLGYLALLRNLRNMQSSGVDDDLIRKAILDRRGASRVLPFRYVAAARACPMFEAELDEALKRSLSALLRGTTVVLVDVSGSMDAVLSAKSDLTRADAAATLACAVHGEKLRVFSFSNEVVEVPPRRGMAGIDAILKSQAHGSTYLAHAVEHVNRNVKHDRLIVVTDEQATDGRVPDPVCNLAYMINVASYNNGVGYGKWTHLDGFSEAVIKWIHAYEKGSSDMEETFEDWCEELLSVFDEYGWVRPDSESPKTGHPDPYWREDWIGYFEDGFSPRDAFLVGC